MWLQILFLVANGLFTFLALKCGFQFYGYGYFFASLLSFAVAFVVTAGVLGRLPYQTFIVQNTSVQTS